MWSENEAVLRKCFGVIANARLCARFDSDRLRTFPEGTVFVPGWTFRCSVISTGSCIIRCYRQIQMPRSSRSESEEVYSCFHRMCVCVIEWVFYFSFEYGYLPWCKCDFWWCSRGDGKRATCCEDALAQTQTRTYGPGSIPTVHDTHRSR